MDLNYSLDSTNATLSRELRQELSQSVWIEALSIPILSWTKPFIPFLELPELVRDSLPFWEVVFIENLAPLRARLDSPEPMTRLEVETLYPSAIVRAMYRFAEREGVAAALEFERWVRRYLRPHESHFPLRRWGLILKLTFLLERPARIPPPTVLQELAPALEELDRKFVEARYEIHEVAPPDPNYSPLSRCLEATLISEVMSHTLSIQMLRKIALELPSKARQEVIQWAEQQAEVMIPRTEPTLLCGERYLRVELPGFEMPSILGFSKGASGYLYASNALQ